MNPIIETIFENKKHKAQIKLAEHNGKWSYGWYYSKDNDMEGGGSSPAFSGRDLFDTRKEARDKALSILLTCFRNDRYKEVQESIKSQFEEQGELFTA